MNNKTKAEFTQIKYELLDFQKYRDGLCRETIQVLFYYLFWIRLHLLRFATREERINPNIYLFVIRWYPIGKG